MSMRIVKRKSSKAKARKGSSYVIKGSAKLGSGERFRTLVSAIAKRSNVRNPEAVAAMVGRKKFGKAKFQKLAVSGKNRK